MEKIEVIVQAKNCEVLEEQMAAIGQIKYRLPAANMYVVQVCPRRLPCLHGVEGIGTLSASGGIATQVV